MPRRVHIAQLQPGRIELPPREAHHVRDVLRLTSEDELELFDNAGNVALARIDSADAAGVFAFVEDHAIRRASASAASAADSRASITICSALPKGDRADWMIEKLSELGVARFIPLITARSVVAPKGTNKRDRWQRLAVESAKQSRRAGVMQIDQLAPLRNAINIDARRHFLSTGPDAAPISTSFDGAAAAIALFIGPEGGWTNDEIEAMRSANMSGLKLTDTILRIETAAIAAAAVVASVLHGVPRS